MPASQSALEDASPEEVGPHAEGASSEKTQRSRNEDSTVLKLKGLPYTTVEQQITDFFDGYAVKQVSFVYDPDGRPSGLVSPFYAQIMSLLMIDCAALFVLPARPSTT